VEAIAKTYHHFQAYSTIQKTLNEQSTSTPISTRKETQCPYQLMNILFSDKFTEEFGTLGNTANCSTLDTGKAAYDKLFWARVREAYALNKVEYNTKRTINPSKIDLHDWRKLWAIWKRVNAVYKAAVTPYTQSGTHESEFYNYCQGKKEAYYLPLHLETRPDLNGMVEADLPEACSLSSSSTITNDKDDDRTTCTTKTNSTKKRPSETIINFIIDTYGNNNNNITMELAEKRIKFLASEAERKERDFQLKLENSKRQEWQNIREDIKKLERS
jgi:hypothetical protein